MDWALVEGGHISCKQISDKPPGLTAQTQDGTDRHGQWALDGTRNGNIRRNEAGTTADILETNGENARNLRKERSKFFGMEERLQKLEEKYARQTQARRKQALEADTKELQDLERTARGHLWLDRAAIRFRVFGPSSFNTALQLVLRPHFLVHFV
jgi:hypothetical protein